MIFNHGRHRMHGTGADLINSSIIIRLSADKAGRRRDALRADEGVGKTRCGDPGKPKRARLWGVDKKKPRSLFAASNKGRGSEVNGVEYGVCLKELQVWMVSFLHI